MKEELISVLIPCYNTAEYLPKCLDSVINQTYKNLEIIVLNDGSTDNSLEIMKEYANKDDRIKIINRENKGVAYSRNELIENSSASFVMFVDSDDTVQNVIVENLYKALIETQSEIAMCNVKKVFADDKINLVSNDEVSYKVYDKKQTIFNLISEGSFYDYPVAKLFLKSTFDSVKFPLNRIYEDSATVFKIYDNAKKTVVLDNCYYNYLQSRDNSITTKKYAYKNLNDNYLAINDRYVFLKEKEPELLNEVKMGYIRNIMTLVERAYYTGDNELIDSDIVKNSIHELKELYYSIDNFENKDKILNPYKLSCLYFLINDDIESYKSIINFVKEK